MKRFSLGLSLLASLGVMLIGCGSDDSGGTAGTGGSGNTCGAGEVECGDFCIDEIAPTLAAIQVQIFDISCNSSSCHDDSLPAAGLNLSSANESAANLIDVDSTQVPTSLRVDPGESTSSYLMNKVLGVDMAPSTQRMPLGGMLCDAQIDAIRTWIDDGALPAE